MSETYKGVMYLNQHNVNSFVKFSEVEKFCDGTLMKIRDNLIDMVNTNKLGKGNRRLKGKDWTDNDVVKSNEMVKKIDQTLKRREQLRRLKEYVGGKPKTVNPRTFVRPIFVSISCTLVDSPCFNLSIAFYISIALGQASIVSITLAGRVDGAPSIPGVAESGFAINLYLYVSFSRQ
ncbi:hypothetical protein Tco_1402749 [Tanacetum coccineum]